MQCANCRKELVGTELAVLLNTDGDFACSPACASIYNRKKEHFLDNVVKDDKKFNQWMEGDDFP